MELNSCSLCGLQYQQHLTFPFDVPAYQSATDSIKVINRRTCKQCCQIITNIQSYMEQVFFSLWRTKFNSAIITSRVMFLTTIQSIMPLSPKNQFSWSTQQLIRLFKEEGITTKIGHYIPKCWVWQREDLEKTHWQTNKFIRIFP
jgi:hypothetical protein